ncbi:MAG: helix-hairpin-helix domain-containing protein [Bacteroidetes bacterium]|nr:helix-hairpin-helix domain-containing protein [Bacteroidota bacterium]
MSHWWKAYFIFSEKEKRGILVLGCILTASILLSLLMSPQKQSVSKNVKVNLTPIHLFKFDPNTIDSLAALSLGIPPKQVKTLIHYREKGGRFYKKEDIFKLYGLDKTLAEKLLPMIELSSISNKEINRKFENNYTRKEYSKFIFSTKSKSDAIWKMDINTADANEWSNKTRLPFHIIQQILQYKNHLGGFSSVTQLNKVYGLGDASYQLLRPHLIVQKNFKTTLNSSTMNFEQWKSLGLFDDQQIFQILKIRKQQAGQITWRHLVILFDLPQNQALWLKTQIVISD